MELLKPSNDVHSDHGCDLITEVTAVRLLHESLKAGTEECHGEVVVLPRAGEPMGPGKAWDVIQVVLVEPELSIELWLADILQRKRTRNLLGWNNRGSLLTLDSDLSATRCPVWRSVAEKTSPKLPCPMWTMSVK